MQIRASTLPDLLAALVPVGVALLLLYAGYSDLRRLQIPNWITLLLILGFVVIAPSLPTAEISSRLIVAAVAFAVGFVLFALNTMGAGDVKLFSGLLLFVPSGDVALFMLIFSATLMVGIATIVLMRRALSTQMASFKSISTPGVFPMGISISAAGLICLFAPLPVI